MIQKIYNVKKIKIEDKQLSHSYAKDISIWLEDGHEIHIRLEGKKKSYMKVEERK